MTKKMGLLIPILLLGSMYGSIWRDEIKTNASNDDTNEREQSMATYSKYNAALNITSANNAPFCYTYPDTVTANLSKLRVAVIYGTFEDYYEYAFENYGTGSSTFPSGSTMTTSLTSFDSATNTATITVSVSIATFSDGGNTFTGFTQTISYASAVVYLNTLVSWSLNTSHSLKTDYVVGDAISCDGLVIDATYTSGTVTGIDLSTADETPVGGLQVIIKAYLLSTGYKYSVIRFEDVGKTVNYQFSIENKNNPSQSDIFNSSILTFTIGYSELLDIEINTVPDKRNYTFGESIDFSGLIIKKIYTGGFFGDVFLSNSELTSAGYKWVYSDDIVGLTDNEIWALPNATTADSSKGNLVILYKGSESNDNLLISDEIIGITVSVALSSIAVTTPPTKTTYKVGETLDLSGMVLTATFSDSSTQVITSGYTSSLANGYLFLLSNVGTFVNTFAYQYNGVTKTATQTLTITKFYSSFAITKQPTDIYYKHGETLDMSGMQISLYASTGEYETVSVTNTAWLASNGYALKWLYDDEVATTAIYHWGDLYLTYSHATYTGGATYNSTNEIDITVYHEVASIAVRTMPTKTTFNVNDTFDASGLEINATYNDGTTSQVVGFYTNPTSGSKLTNAQLGTLSVTVDYIENGVMVSTSFNVTVLASVQLTSITVKTLPTKAIYKQGEAFVSTGLVITANYNNSTTVDLTAGFTLNPNDGYIFTNDDKVAGSKSIVVSLTDYDDEITKTVSFAVSISTTATLISVQTPVTYVDEYGELDELYVRFITPNTLSNGEPYINFPYLTEAYWNATTGLKVQIDESSYSKSGFEVPWMGYAVQFGNANNIVIGDNLVHRFLPESGTVDTYADKSTVMRYVWIISTIPITEDNAESLSLPVKSDYYDTATSKFISTANNTCFLTVSSNTLSIAFKSLSLYHNDVYQSSVNNSTQLQGKHIAVFAVQYGKLKSVEITTPTSIASVKKQFMFGLNYIPSSATATLTLTVNGWKLY